MKIVILTYADVDGIYAATLMERGHEIAFFGGAIHEEGMKHFVDYDGCLLLGTEPEFLEFADAFEAVGKTVWRQLADIPNN